MASDLNRRDFNTGLSFGFSQLLGFPALASAHPRIVIVGGGAGGASVAIHLKLMSPIFDITLIEKHTEYTSCFFSNPYIGGLYNHHHLTHNYNGLKALDIKIIHQTVKSIDLSKREIYLNDNSICSFDRLVLSPGIDFIYSMIEGYSDETSLLMPHAWQGKYQTELLRKNIEEMEDGGTVVISVPKLPYRCPPGPYERACLIANYLSLYKPKSKVLLLDANFTFTKQRVFTEIIEKLYSKYIEIYLSNDIDDYTVYKIEPKSKTIYTKSGLQIAASVANIIPPQKAGRIALETGLGESDWCPVSLENFLSRKAESVYVIGDSARAEEMPKSAYAAYSQGVQVAAHITAEFQNGPQPTSKYRNICWSIVSQNAAIKIGAEYVPGTLKVGREALLPTGAFVSQPGESDEVRKAVFDEATAWYTTLTSTIFNEAQLGDKGK